MRARSAAVASAVVAVGAATLMGLTAGIASASGPGECTENVNVRAEPRIDAPIVALCEAGTAVETGTVRNGFIEITDLGGWAAEEYISVDSAPASSPSSTSSTPSGSADSTSSGDSPAGDSPSRFGTPVEEDDTTGSTGDTTGGDTTGSDTTGSGTTGGDTTADEMQAPSTTGSSADDTSDASDEIEPAEASGLGGGLL